MVYSSREQLRKVSGHAHAHAHAHVVMEANGRRGPVRHEVCVCGRTLPRPTRPTLKRLPLTIVAELGAERRAGQISRLFHWSVAELVGEAGGAPQMPLNQLGLHRRAIAWWLRGQRAYRAATEDLPASLQYTPHHELQSGAVEEEDEDEAAGAGAIDLPPLDDEEGIAAPMCHCVPEQGMSVGWWRQLEPPPRPPRAEYEDTQAPARRARPPPPAGLFSRGLSRQLQGLQRPRAAPAQQLQSWLGSAHPRRCHVSARCRSAAQRPSLAPARPRPPPPTPVAAVNRAHVHAHELVRPSVRVAFASLGSLTRSRSCELLLAARQ